MVFTVPLLLGFLLFLGSYPQNPQNAFGQSPGVSLSIPDNTNSGSGINPENLGSPVYTENTQSTGIRVLDVNVIPTVEVSYSGNGTIGGMATQTIGTTINKMGGNGSVHTLGQAIILAPDGQSITYTTQSRGYYNPDGSFSDSGIMVFNLPISFTHSQSTNSSSSASSTSTTGQPMVLSSFDDMVGIYKKTVDRYGNGLTTVWEWK